MTLRKQQKYFCSENRILAKLIQCIEKIRVLNLTNGNVEEQYIKYNLGLIDSFVGAHSIDCQLSL